MRVVAMAMVLALIGVPLAQAGSVEDPEIVDDPDDHATGVSEDPFQGYDILYTFFTDGDPDCGAAHMRVQIGMQNIFTDGAQSPGAAFSAAVYFTINGNDYRTYLRPAGNLNTGGDPSVMWIYMYDITNAPSDRIEIPGGFDNQPGNEYYYWCVPHEQLNGAQPGDVVTKVWSRTYLDNYGVLDLAPDGAPDEVGRDYYLGGTPPAPAASAVNISVLDANATLQDNQATWQIRLNNTGLENETVAFEVRNLTDGFGAWVEPNNLTIAPSGAATIRVQAYVQEDSNLTGSVQGLLTLAYNGTVGQGLLNLSFMGEVTEGGSHGDPRSAPDDDGPDAGTGSDSGVGPDGNETGSVGNETLDGDDGKESPGAGMTLVLALLAVALVRSRRKL